MPMLRLCAGTPEILLVPTYTSPESANSKPAAMRSAVVFPHPDGPSRLISSPSLTSRSRCCSAVVAAKVLRTASNTSWAMPRS